jgi:hypothetical protein
VALIQPKMASNASAEAGPTPEPIPIYRIDLSLPPSERYTQLATSFAPKMQEIIPLFDEVLSVAIPWPWLRRFIQWISTLVLRRVYSSEETQELKGIAKASGVDMYFLVALNVLLDSLMGCTSGGVLTRPEKMKETEINPSDEDERTPRMMHIRTLDWGMDELRSVLVVLEFVKSKSKTPEKVIARTVTYAGFVGVLTGVRYVCLACLEYIAYQRVPRPNLSISLNVRPTHHCSTLKLRIHQILVIFGFRPSIVSILRNNFIPRLEAPLPLDQLTTTLGETRSAPCYLILSSGTSTTVIEKDLLDGKVRSASDFIVHTNHDIKDTEAAQNTHDQKERSTVLGTDAFLEESEERRDCIQKKWNSLVKRQEKKRKEKGEAKEEQRIELSVVNEKTLQGWVSAYPIMNECSHFGCIMDPKTGTIRWMERGVLEDSDDEGDNFHVSDHE